MTSIATTWRLTMRTYHPEDPDSEEGYVYSNFDYESEHDAVLALEEFERMYAGYPVDFWVEEIMVSATCY